MVQYFLALKDELSYSPILLGDSNSKKSSLEIIDEYTKNYNEDELIKYFIEKGLAKEKDIGKELVILYEKKDCFAEIEDGILTKNEKDAVDLNYIAAFLIESLQKRENLQLLIEKYEKRILSKHTQELIETLKNIDNISIISFALNLVKLRSIPYEEIRMLGIYIYRNIGFRLQKEEGPKLTFEKKE